MLVGILFTAIVSLSVGTFSLLTFLGRPSRPGSHVFSFTLFWLFMSVVWYLTALSDFFGYMQLRQISVIMTYVVQVFVGASLIIALYFLDSTALRGWRKPRVVFLYIILYIIFLVNLARFGVRARTESFFTTQITSSEQVLMMFMIMFIPLWIAAFVLLIQTVRNRATEDVSLRNFYIAASTSLILLGAAGSIDEIGIVAGWVLTTSRLVSLVAAISAYVGVLSLQETKELVI